MWLTLCFVLFAATQPSYVAACGRSPIPQPGETITRPLAYIRLAPSPAPDVVEVTPPVAWNLARHHLGETITVEGTVISTRRFGEITFLNFHKDWQDKFYIVVFAEAHNDNFHPESVYLDKTLHITGKIKLHNDRPQIQVRDLSQIQIIQPSPSNR